MIKKFVDDFKIIENTALNATNYLIKIQTNNDLPVIKPGQFINIEISNSREVFLRRPFSIFDINYQQNILSFIVKILGRGSQKLTEIQIGDKLNIIYPLGKSFTHPDRSDRILLIGGGSGVAPMLFLAKESGLYKKNVDIILGAKSAEEHIVATKYSQYANLYFTSEDGSLGEKGYVTNHSIFKKLNDYSKIYACGPLGMMKAVAKEATQNDIFCEVSLENLMACGFGVCLCCIETTQKGNLCVCTEGPVFNVKELRW